MKCVQSLLFLLALSFVVALGGCAGQDNARVTEAGNALSGGGKANAFNPYMQQKLPNTRGLSAEGKAFGGQAVAIEAETAHRPHWREELYPVVYGRSTAPHEILVLLDFAKPQSNAVWQAVLQATASLSPESCKVVVFAKNSENYGTDLMGLAIWNVWARKGQAMPCLTYMLKEWHAAKTAQRTQGKVKVFNNEYDSAVANGYPIHYNWLMGLRPAISENDELRLSRYIYDAGNVNMYQAVQVIRFYGITSLPAVVVDGKPLGKVSAKNIVAAVGR